MATAGIVRRIDELGRIVIPKELRRTMRLNVGDEMEIVSTGDELTLRRKGGFDSISQIAKEVCKLLFESVGCDVVLFDTHRVTQAEGKGKKTYKDATLSPQFLNRLVKRKGETLSGEDVAKVFELVELDGEHFCFEPIVSGGDLVGGVALLTHDEPSDSELCHLNFCARILEASLS